MHVFLDRNSLKDLQLWMCDYFYEEEKLQSTADRKYDMISLLVLFEPPLTVQTRYKILHLSKILEYGVLDNV
jgi:hypothetical protein